MENDVVRLRRASDLAVVAEALDVAVGPLAFGGGGAWLAIGAGRELSVRAVPSLTEIARVPVERRSLDVFSVAAIAADPSGSVVVTCDDGGRDEDDRGGTTDRDPAQVTLFEATTGAKLAVVDRGERARAVLFDPWRGRIYALGDAGISVFSPSGEPIAKWRGVEEHDGRPARCLAMSARFLATIADHHPTVGWTMTLSDPLTFRAVGRFDVPDEAPPSWTVASPDGTILVTGHENGFRVWLVTVDPAPLVVERDPNEHPAVELARLAGPIVHASTLPPADVARAVAEGRAMVIYVSSSMGSRDVSLSAAFPPGAVPDLVLARPVPAHLREITDANWEARSDVHRYVNVELPRVRGRAKRARLPPRPVFPRVVHEGRGGYIAIDTGAREYRYPIELVGEGRFCIHYPAGNRLRDRDVHLAALEEMCRAEPSRWTLERRDR
jgi:hypothetical protein